MTIFAKLVACTLLAGSACAFAKSALLGAMADETERHRSAARERAVSLAKVGWLLLRILKVQEVFLRSRHPLS